LERKFDNEVLALQFCFHKRFSVCSFPVLSGESSHLVVLAMLVPVANQVRPHQLRALVNSEQFLTNVFTIHFASVSAPGAMAQGSMRWEQCKAPTFDEP
jgi:hypothetical protein